MISAGIALKLAKMGPFFQVSVHIYPCHGNSPGAGGGVLPYIGYIGMYRCEGYGFKALYSGVGYINQRVWV